MNLFSSLWEKVRLHFHHNVKADMNKDGLVKNTVGIASIACFGGSIYEASQKQYYQATALGIGGTGFGFTYYKLDQKDRQERKENLEHEEKMLEKRLDAEKERALIMHPRGSENSVAGIDENASFESQNRNLETWADNYRRKFGKLPSVPAFVSPFINGCPQGYEEPMLFNLLSEFGALCFSKCRAKYLDDKMHAPNIGVVIEGNWGAGKGKFEDAFNYIFKHVIESDIQKLKASDNKTHIIQAAGIAVSESKFGDVLADSQGLHVYAFQPEIIAAYNAMKKGSGLRFEHLRYAFDNSNIYVNNRNKDSKNGFFPVFLNYTFTGTPADTRTFIGKELEGGTASRIIWTCIPESGINIEHLSFPGDKEMQKIYEQIQEWRCKYCYATNSAGVDVAVEDSDVNLDYVCSALKGWIEMQGRKSVEESNAARKDMRARAAASAFHCAIVLHMLAGQPTEQERRQEIVNLVIYIADYILERFLFKFGDSQNEQRKANHDAEYVDMDSSTGADGSFTHVAKSEEQSCAEKMKALYDLGHGQKSIANKCFGSCDDKYVKKVKYILGKYYSEEVKWPNPNSQSK